MVDDLRMSAMNTSKHCETDREATCISPFLHKTTSTVTFLACLILKSIINIVLGSMTLLVIQLFH